MLDGLFVTPAVTAILEALGTANADGAIAVVGSAKLARALGARRAPAGEAPSVIPVGLPPRAARTLASARTRRAAPALADHRDDTSTLDAGSLAAVIGVDITDDAAWQATLGAWSRVVRDGGAVVLVDRSAARRPAEASRRALCAGLGELEQRHAGRLVITSGLVTHL